jgi:hypothetical protein
MKFDVGAERPDMLERTGVRRVRLEHLEPDDAAVGFLGNLPDPSRRKGRQVLPFRVHGERPVEYGVGPRVDDGIQNADDLLGVVNDGITNAQCCRLRFHGHCGPDSAVASLSRAPTGSRSTAVRGRA